MSTPVPIARWKPYAALVLAMALWGSSFPAFKYCLEHFDGWFFVWGRLILASLLTVCLLPRLPVQRPQRGDWKAFAFMGFCEPCLYFIFELYALKFTSSAQAGVIVALLPLIVAGVAALVLGERITRRVLLGLLLAVAGAAWMSLGSSATESSPRPILGNLLEFCAMICATGYVITAKRLTARYSPYTLVVVQNAIGAVFFLPFVLGLGEFPEISKVPPTAWVTLLYLGGVVSLLAFYCNNVGLRHIPASRATIFGNLIPVFAIGLAGLFLGERLSPAQFAACGLILVGLVVSQREPRRTAS